MNAYRLTAALDAADRTDRIAARREYRLTAPEIAQEIARAVRSIPAMRRASEYERDALAAEVYLRFATATNAPTLTRGDTGRAWFRAAAASIMAQSRAWRDTCEDYRTRAQASDESRGLIARPPAAPTYDDADADADPLTAAADRLAVDAAHALDTADAAPVPAALDALAADALARLTADAPLTDAQCKRAHCAMVRAAAVASGIDPLAAMTDLARATGQTLATVRVRASEGAKVLRAYPPAALTAAWRDAAAQHCAHAATADRVSDAHIAAGAARTRATAADVRAARAAVDALLLAGGAWDAASLTHGAPMVWPDRRPDAADCRSVGGRRGRGVVAYLAAVWPAD
jgi:hypothetical protein